MKCKCIEIKCIEGRGEIKLMELYLIIDESLMLKKLHVIHIIIYLLHFYIFFFLRPTFLKILKLAL